MYQVLHVLNDEEYKCHNCFYENYSDALTAYNEIVLSSGDTKRLLKMTGPYEVPCFYVGTERVEGWEQARLQADVLNETLSFCGMETCYRSHDILNNQHRPLEQEKLTWKERIYYAVCCLKGHFPDELFL
ncbi:hypothetical protein H0A36_17630 [Endozoicomonas sp. SM1973]|uniref:Uncharacterized protein n=1 Tax=Spartinivicinus marinus TaxID=2994442 RepID=A0A853IB38_9GAMM|nr:hypothetical protein [Spartinivicinus marinus]MCX4030195.1 hypothetical protein [Spartinivicinus marinus]NYZ67838.1 hypothetical protein [Spartinivicinus marinus]